MKHAPRDLAAALAEIGQDEIAREHILTALNQWETDHLQQGRELREEVTGVVVDALFAQVGCVTKTLVNGIIFNLPYRSKIARDFAMADQTPDHVWEPQTTKLLLMLAATARQAIFGGAYAGDQAILVAHKIACVGGHVHCFEPNREQSLALIENAKANNICNVTVSNDGLWSSKCWLKLHGLDSHAFPVEADSSDDGAFPAISIEHYCSQHAITTLDLIMLDIEGGEFRALQGAQKFLEADDAPDVIIEIHSLYTDWTNGLDDTDVLCFLHELGYTTYAVRDYQSNVAMSHAPIELVPTNTAYIEGPHHGFNILASKKSNIVQLLNAKLVTGVSPKLLKHRDPKLHQPAV